MDTHAGFLGCGYLAQDRVDHAGGVRFACGAAELDALAERGVGGNAVEVKELEGSEAEGDRNGLCDALTGTLEESADASIEGDLPTEDTHDEGGGEVAVFGGERVDVGGVEEFVAVAFVLADEGKNLKRCEACGSDFFERCFNRCSWACCGGAPLGWLRGCFGRRSGQSGFL